MNEIEVKEEMYRKATLLLVIILLAATATLNAQSTTFSYQGNLNTNGTPANGNFDFEFALFDSLVAGNQIGTTLTRNGVIVANGTFAVSLDFGSQFTGANRFVEVRVRAAGGTFIPLSPRQQILSGPYAIRSVTASVADTATVANLATNATTATNATQLGGIPSANYVQSGAAVINAGTQFNISGGRILSIGGTRNTFVGSGAGTPSPNGFATDNSFVGYLSGVNNTTGAANTFVGSNSGFSNTDGGENSFFGAEAGMANVGGDGNSFFGKSAGKSNTTGNNNSFFGATAGDANTTGSENSFFGRAAGGANTTGGQNSIFGRNAGQLNVSGNNNSFFGFEAGKANIANGNSFFGSQSGLVNATGASNAFFGFGTGAENTIGSDNSFFGVNTGRGNTEGARNTYIGRLAGRFNTTGFENTYLGYNTASSSITGNNNIAVGASANVADGLSFATVIGSGASVSTSNTVVIGRSADQVLVRGNLSVNADILSPYSPNFDNVSDAADVHACVAPSSIPGYNYVGKCVSSIKYKKDVEVLRSGIEIIRRLQPVTYRWKTTGNAAIGLIAEEVFKVEPKLTSRDENDETQSVKYDSVTVVLVNAVKEQQAQIETLVSRLKTVESELSELKKRKSVKPTALRMKSSIRRR